jgi:predicted RNase H-like HicB family nuclease
VERQDKPGVTYTHASSVTLARARHQGVGLKKTLRYPARYRLDEDGTWEVWLPDINSDGIGVYTQGDTIEEAREMAREALTGCLLAKQDMGAPLDAPGPLPDAPGWEWVEPGTVTSENETEMVCAAIRYPARFVTNPYQGGFDVTIPNLGGGDLEWCTWGATLEVARVQASELVTGYIELCVRFNDDLLPVPTNLPDGEGWEWVS